MGAGVAGVRLLAGKTGADALVSLETARTKAGTCDGLEPALAQAVEWRIIADNPADRVRLPAKTGEAMTPLTPEQARVFLEAIRSHPLETLFTLAIATGMRQGEILGLRWADLDGHRLHIRHTLVRMDGGW